MEYIINKNLKGKVLQETTTHALLLLPDGSRIVYSKSGLKKAVDSGLTPIQTKEKNNYHFLIKQAMGKTFPENNKAVLIFALIASLISLALIVASLIVMLNEVTP